MRIINNAMVAFYAALGKFFGTLYARHQLYYHQTSALDLRENIINEQGAIKYHEAEALRIESALVRQQLEACRQRSAALEGRLQALTGSVE